MSRRRQGVSSIEFALVLPVMLTFMTAIFDYGWFYMEKSSVQNAVKDATRIAVAADKGDDPRVLAEETMAGILGDLGFSCSGSCTVTASAVTSGGYHVLVSTVNWPYVPLIGLVPTPDTIRVEHTMLLEHQDLTWYTLP